MDLRLGKVLAELETDGLADNTIILFFGDNGRLDPRCIHWCYDSVLRVPMILKWPRNLPAPSQVSSGKVDTRILSILDVTATTL